MAEVRSWKSELDSESSYFAFITSVTSSARMPTLAVMKSKSNLLRLTSGDTAVVIAPDRGAIVTSFCVADRELMYFDQATFNEPLKNVRGGVPILFPSPGKLDNDRWSYDSKQGTLKQHGFARNLSWRVDARTDTSATLVLG